MLAQLTVHRSKERHSVFYMVVAGREREIGALPIIGVVVRQQLTNSGCARSGERAVEPVICSSVNWRQRNVGFGARISRGTLVPGRACNIARDGTRGCAR